MNPSVWVRIDRSDTVSSCNKQYLFSLLFIFFIYSKKSPLPSWQILAMSASAIPTAFSASALNSSGYTAFSTAVPTNSSTVVIAPTSTFSSQVTVASAASSSSMPASNMDSPVHCLLQPFDQGCYNLTGSPLNSAQNVTGLEGQLITSSVVGVVFFLLFCILRTR